jgi:WD40 repeat protein
MTFSHDDRRLASGSSDKTVRIWNAETGALQQTLKSHTGSVYSVAFSQDGRRLASSSSDKTVQIWNAETGAPQQTLEVGTTLTKLSFSLDGSVLNTEVGSFNIHTFKWSSCCLREDRSWIACNDSNILWLPPEYRSHSAIKGQTVTVFITGRVVIVNILL